MTCLNKFSNQLYYQKTVNKESDIMPKTKYDGIYQELQSRIFDGTYAYQQTIPSETMLTSEFGCSRNTVRRAIEMLSSEGFVQSVHGKGVIVIYDAEKHSIFSLNRIESFTEASVRNNLDYVTKVLLFSELETDERISRRTGFPVGCEIYYIQRLRIIDGSPLIIDHNYFRKDIVKGLTKEIAKGSIYAYIEGKLRIVITTTKRVIRVEPITEHDEKYLQLDGCNCVAAINNSTYNSNGEMFEFTQSRHSPKYFEFHEISHRSSI